MKRLSVRGPHGFYDRGRQAGPQCNRSRRPCLEHVSEERPLVFRRWAAVLCPARRRGWDTAWRCKSKNLLFLKSVMFHFLR